MKEDLLYRYISGKTSEKEDEEILAWLDSDPEGHIGELNRIRYICQAADCCEPRRKRVLPLRRILRRMFEAAACAAMLAGVWYISELFTYNSITNRTIVTEVPAGQYINITLEDGTTVWLNADTRLEYPAVFGKKSREVYLSGEAIFDVAHDESRPFVVNTFVSEIEVLGTKFNVYADERDNRFSTTLVEGHVKVSNLHNPTETYYMNPHDVVMLKNGHFYKTFVADFDDMAWTKGLIHLKSMPFNELMNIFERSFDIDIVLCRKDLPRIDVISGDIRISDGIDNAMEILSRISDFTYEYDTASNTIYIK